MKILIFLVIITIIVIWALTKAKSSQKSKLIKADRFDPQIKVSITTDTTHGSDKPDTGAISPSSDGGWILNPKSTFPLTIYGVDESIAKKVKNILEEGYYSGAYSLAQSLTPLVARSNLRCKELEEYIINFKPDYLKQIEELKQSSDEWASASEKDRDDLLSEFRDIAIDSLDIRPYCGLEILFECEPADITLDDALIDRFGFDNFKLYIRYAGNLDKVHVIPPDHRDRHGFEELVKAGLAIRGEEISLSLILDTLKIKDMTELVTDLNPPAFKRKAKAIDYLLNLPDIKQRISKKVAFRELFKLKDLPEEFSQIDLNSISSAWNYAREVATIIAHTYTMGGYSLRNSHEDLSFIKGWEISPVGDAMTCPYCERAASKSYSKSRKPKTPLHIGCRCGVQPVI